MKGSLRQRGAASWELRVYAAVNADTATEMLNAGVPLPVVARRLDHQRPSTTLNFYAQAVPGGDAHAAATLEAVLAGGGGRSVESVEICGVEPVPAE